MQIFPKTKGFCNKRGLFRKKLTLFNKNYIYILRKKLKSPILGFRKNPIYGEKNRDLWGILQSNSVYLVVFSCILFVFGKFLLCIEISGMHFLPTTPTTKPLRFNHLSNCLSSVMGLLAIKVPCNATLATNTIGADQTIVRFPNPLAYKSLQTNGFGTNHQHRTTS